MNSYADPQKLKDLKQQANRLPLEPGVYLMKDKSGEIIYIGKAKALKNRVTQYFGSGRQHVEKVRRMISNVDRFEYIVCDSEFEALILENSLIKQNQPKYNILLKDDKGYHYIKITNDKWKRIETAKTVDKNGEYIGPYNSGYIVKETVDEVRRIFRLPDCSRNFDTPSKPCLNYHIGLCDAPCRGNIKLSDYLETVNSARDFIKSGNYEDAVKSLEAKMYDAAERLDFEAAAKLRDRINAIKRMNEKQKVIMTPYKSQDVVACASIGDLACVEMFIFRNYRLTDKQHFYIDGISDKAILYSEFLQRYYADRDDIPARIVIDSEIENSGLLERWLSEKSGRKVQFVYPKQGEQKRLLDMCLTNAAENLSSRTERSGREMSAINEIAQLFGLPQPPRYIEAYDISNTAGSENVAGMIVYKDGRPYKQAYKRFKIKSFSGQDDFRSMAEVLDRRFAEYEKGEDEYFSILPDLILLDGGKGQMSAVVPVLKKHNIKVPVFGMVKDSAHRTRAIATEGGDIAIKANRRAYTLITNIQDEVHRFAIDYHKNRRSAALLNSELLSIEGVGKKRAAALMKHFKTIKRIKEATIQELSAVKGFTVNAAEAVYRHYHSEG